MEFVLEILVFGGNFARNSREPREFFKKNSRGAVGLGPEGIFFEKFTRFQGITGRNSRQKPEFLASSSDFVKFSSCQAALTR